MVYMLDVKVGRGTAVNLEYCDWGIHFDFVRAFLQP